MLFNPALLFLTLWGFEIGFQMLDSTFYPFTALTWSIVATAIVCFTAGGIIGGTIPVKVATKSLASHSTKFVRRFLIGSFVAYLVIVVAAGMAFVNAMGGPGALPSTAAGFRTLVIEDFLGDRLLFSYLRVFYFGVGLALFGLAFASRLSKRAIAALIVFGVICAVLTTGRLCFLLFATAASALLYRQGKISVHGLLWAGAIFVLLFFAMAVVLEKGEADSSISETVLWNARIYFGSSLACFNNYVRTGEPTIAGGALLPDVLRPVINWLGTSLHPKPALLPFAYVPEQCNTYTALFPYYHDGDFLGVAIFGGAAGIAHQYFYRIHRQSNSPVVWYFFAISLYPLAMTIFEEAYLSSLGFWVLLFIPPAVFVCAERLRGGTRRFAGQAGAQAP